MPSTTNKGGVVHAQLASCASARGCGHGLMLARDTWPASLIHHGGSNEAYILILAVTVMTAASAVLAKSVRFLEHVSPGYYAGILVHVNLSISSFSHNNVRLLMVYRCLPCDLLFPRLSLYRVRQTDGQTDRIVNYSKSRCACARGLIIDWGQGFLRIFQYMELQFLY